MTKKELMQCYYLNREIMHDTEELVNLKILARGDDNGVAFADEEEIKRREKVIVEKIRKCKQLKERIDKFLNSIDDSLTRQIFYYRYVRCMSWKKVSYMTGGYNSEDGVRKIAERYLMKNNNE
jgi:DNA-binding MltR family transcriptional regulator